MAKASDFESDIRRFESYHLSLFSGLRSESTKLTPFFVFMVCYTSLHSGPIPREVGEGGAAFSLVLGTQALSCRR